MVNLQVDAGASVSTGGHKRVANRAGILIRVSTARQGQEGASTDVQRRDCGDYCERMGWQVAMVEEDHQSGTSFDRPGFRKLAEAAERGEIDRLVIWDIDRFGRNLIDSLLALRDFEDAGVEIHDRNGPVKNDLLRDIRLAGRGGRTASEVPR